MCTVHVVKLALEFQAELHLLLMVLRVLNVILLELETCLALLHALAHTRKHARTRARAHTHTDTHAQARTLPRFYVRTSGQRKQKTGMISPGGNASLGGYMEFGRVPWAVGVLGPP